MTKTSAKYIFGGVDLKKSKRLLSICLAGAMLAGSVPVTFIAGAVSDSTVKIAAISDIRYQANGTDADGMMVSKSAALLDAALEQVKSSDADALLVTGDITNDGSRASHQAVAAKLAQVEAEGIDVYVIPGERDVREGGVNLGAQKKTDFETLYADFGYSEGTQDPNSASYVVNLGKGFTVVMSDSVAANGQGQLTQWAVTQAQAAAGRGETVFAASHHPVVGRGSVDRTFMDLLNTLAGVEIELGGTFRLYTNDPVQAAASLDLVDETRILPQNGADPAALADAGVKYVFTGHGCTMSIAGYTTTNGAELYDVMTGSLVGSGSGVRFATLNKGVDGMKEQRAEFSAQMLESAVGVPDVQAAAHDALSAYMPTEVDNAIDILEKVLTHLLPNIQANVQIIVRDIDLAALGVELPNIDLPGISVPETIKNVKSGLNSIYVAGLFNLLTVPAIHNVIVDVRTALEKMDFNGRDFYGFLADIFGAIQRGDGKTPASVEGIFDALRNQETESLVALIHSFADYFNPTNLVNLLNQILDLKFDKGYSVSIVSLSFNIQLRQLLAQPTTILTANMLVDPVVIDLWTMLDGLAALPNGQTISQVARPLVNALILGGDNDASTPQTPARFTQNLKDKASTVVDLLIGFGVGDLIGENVFAQGQNATLVARTVTLEEVGAYLDELAPDQSADALTAAEWAKVRDALNALGRFTAEQQASVNGELTAATETDPAYTQADKVRDLMDGTFYAAVAADFTDRVNALPETVTLDDRDTVYGLRSEYDQFYAEIKANISPETVEKLTAAADAIYALEVYDPAVSAVIDAIDAIGDVTVEKEAQIVAARAAYEGLDVRQQKLVTNYTVLVAAEEALETAKENEVLITAVENEIDKIGTVDTSTACARRIQRAREAYDSLAPELQPGVSNYAVLTAAEARYAELVAAEGDAAAAAPVIAMIDAIGTVTLESGDKIAAAEDAYALLTESQQALVTNYQTLLDAREAYEALVAQSAADQQAAQAVIDLITSIGDVTLESGGAIAAAEAAYGELTAAQQELVTNYYVLTAARAAYDALVKAQADQAAADAVEELIAAIGEVTVEKEPQIVTAREAYNKLTADQRRLVENLSVLTDAEAQLSVLKNDFLFEDANTGITLRAGSGVLPLDTAMQVTVVESGAVYDAVAAQYDDFVLYDIVLLSGGKAVAPDGVVTITVPQNALDNAVYTVSGSGVMTAMDAALENGAYTFTSSAAGLVAVVRPIAALNTAALLAAVEAYEELVPDQYQNFESATQAYEAAQALLEADLAVTAVNQRRIDAAVAALTAAVAQLIPEDANFTALRQAVLKARRLDAEDYTNYDVVAQALANAQTILDATEKYDARNQAVINAAAEALNNAIAQLAFAAPDFALIDQALAVIPTDSQNYTTESWAKVLAAESAAKELKATLTRADADWEAKVAAAAQAVTDAVRGLEVVNVTPANKAALERAVKLAALYNANDYVNYDDVTFAVEEAQALLLNPRASQEDVDAAEDAILDAIGALEWANTSFLYRAATTVVRLFRLPSIFF